MAISISIIDSDEIIAEVRVNDEIQTIAYEDIKQVAPEFNSEESEGCWIAEFGDIILGYIVIAEGQGTIIFGWDIKQNKIVHATNGSFAQTLYLNDGYVYSLCDISGWGIKSHLELYRHKFGTLDTTDEGELLNYNVEPVYDSTYNNNDFWIKKEPDKIIAGYKEYSGEVTIN